VVADQIVMMNIASIEQAGSSQAVWDKRDTPEQVIEAHLSAASIKKENTKWKSYLF